MKLPITLLAAALAGAADDEQRCLAGTFGIHGPGDGDIKGVGISEKNATHARTYAEDRGARKA